MGVSTCIVVTRRPPRTGATNDRLINNHIQCMPPIRLAPGYPRESRRGRTVWHRLLGAFPLHTDFIHDRSGRTALRGSTAPTGATVPQSNSGRVTPNNASNVSTADARESSMTTSRASHAPPSATGVACATTASAVASPSLARRARLSMRTACCITRTPLHGMVDGHGGAGTEGNGQQRVHG